KAEAEAAAKKKAEEEAKKKAEAEAAAKKKAEEEAAAKRRAEEEAKMKAEAEAAAKKAEEEAEAAAKKKAEGEAAAKEAGQNAADKKAEEEEAIRSVEGHGSSLDDSYDVLEEIDLQSSQGLFQRLPDCGSSLLSSSSNVQLRQKLYDRGAVPTLVSYIEKAPDFGQSEDLMQEHVSIIRSISRMAQDASTSGDLAAGIPAFEAVLRRAASFRKATGSQDAYTIALGVLRSLIALSWSDVDGPRLVDKPLIVTLQWLLAAGAGDLELVEGVLRLLCNLTDFEEMQPTLIDGHALLLQHESVPREEKLRARIVRLVSFASAAWSERQLLALFSTSVVETVAESITDGVTAEFGSEPYADAIEAMIGVRDLAVRRNAAESADEPRVRFVEMLWADARAPVRGLKQMATRQTTSEFCRHAAVAYGALFSVLDSDFDFGANALGLD
ncbi:MAG TPA: hypothetical protein VJB16_05520, partial [archaeon]|nr:hypothetical protein [archaeon]